MFYRKLNEFFRRPNPRFPDDLKSELFEFTATGGFMSDADVEELHKRVSSPDNTPGGPVDQHPTKFTMPAMPPSTR